MKDDEEGVCHAIRGFSVALGSPHANRVNASESDRVGHRISGAHFYFSFWFESADTLIDI